MAHPAGHRAGAVCEAFRNCGALSTEPGLQSSGDILLDAVNGIGTFYIRSKGTLDPDDLNQFIPVEFTVREGSPNAGAPERTDYLMLVAQGTWSRTVDFVGSWSGLVDPHGPAGIAGGVTGGVMGIGDIGSIVKNLWRATPFSDKDFDYVETTLAVAGVGTEAFFIFGEVADGPISAAKTLQAATRGTQFAKVLSLLVKRAQSNVLELAQLGPKLGKFAVAVAKTDFGLQVAKFVFTSEELMLAGLKVVDELGDLGAEFIDILARKAALRGIGIRAAQDVTTLISRLSGDTLNYLKALPATELDAVVERLGFIVKAGKVDIAQLRRLLDNNHLFTAAYDRAMMLQDLRILADSERLGTLANYLKGATLAGPIQGRLYELQTAARLVDANPNWKVTWVSKYAKEVDPLTGKRLASTDVDFIIDDGTSLIYYQAKSSAGAFGDSAAAARREAERWVRIVQQDAERTGVTNQVIKYVVPPGVTLPQSVSTYFTEFQQQTGMVIEVVTSPLLR